MGNSPTDKSKDFIKSGMTLITQIDSDRLEEGNKQEKSENYTERLDDK